jgi:hypothetical protein
MPVGWASMTHGTRRDTWVRGVRLSSYEVGRADGEVIVVVP